MTKEQLLAETEDALVAAPSALSVANRRDSAVQWVGNAIALLRRWAPDRKDLIDATALMLGTGQARFGHANLMQLLHEARADLRLELGLNSAVVSKGMVFDYFDHLRKLIALAKSEVFFIDPYLNVDFVSRYLWHVPTGVAVRLLGRKQMETLLPAVDLFAKQTNTSVEVRSSADLHDRYLVVDRAACYQSGASFKDGALNSGTTITQITDAFPAVLAIYERLWSNAKLER